MATTREALLDEAEGLIRSRGYSGFSYADLSEAVGIRKASIHHHFPSKADLAVALLAAYDARYDAALSAISAETDDGLLRVRAYSELYLLGIEKGLGCLCAAFAAELTTLPDDLRTGLTRFFDKHISWIGSVLAAGQANGTIRPDIQPAASARLIVAALEGALMVERFAGGPEGFRGTSAALNMALRPD